MVAASGQWGESSSSIFSKRGLEKKAAALAAERLFLAVVGEGGEPMVVVNEKNFNF